MEKILINIKNLYSEFESHLQANKRVLFSGKYGTGKTYFLREYFQSNESKYNVFHLFPVNYQVSNNEDIFELIKIDILGHILDKGWSFKDEEQQKISKTLALQFYTIEKASSAFKAITQIFTLGKSKSVANGADELGKIINGFTKYYKELSVEKDTFDKIIEFAEIFKNKRGSIYESDNITQLISELIRDHSGIGQQRKENILIIDDLDRIEPEHIFRILNVFSAHFDIVSEEENKFGFGKVIFVCDLNNIRNIFSAKYGVNTDFNGYINKFFSSHIYYFDNKIEIKKTITDFVYKKLSSSSIGNNYYNQLNETIIMLLSVLIHSNEISIRQLRNIEHYDFTTSSYHHKNRNISSNPFLYMIIFLMKIFNNDIHKLKSVFSNLVLSEEELRFFDRENRIFLKYLIPLADIEQINSNNQENGNNFVFQNEKQNLKIKYLLKQEDYCLVADIKSVESYNLNKTSNEETPNTLNVSYKDVFNLFEVVINKLHNNGILAIN